VANSINDVVGGQGSGLRIVAEQEQVPFDTSIAGLGRRARAASRVLRLAPTAVKDAALLAAAGALTAATDQIVSANGLDLERAEASGTSVAVLDRLRLNRARVEAMATGLRQVAALADPVGEVIEGWSRPNGIHIDKVRVPLGVVAIIYENRPNVTSDAFGLCVKSGNVAFLRGSSGAIESNKAIAAALREGLVTAGLPADCVVLVEDTSYEAAREFMQLRESVDVLIPRGGPSLIKSILDNATVPYVIDGDGNCHLYVDDAADLDMALKILVNGKTQRPSVCNALESLVVHVDVAADFLPRVVAELETVELVGDQRARQFGGPRIAPANPEDFAREFLDLKLSIAVVDSIDEAIDHIGRNGTGHTEVIITNDLINARRFQREVDAASVMVNASSRFTDGEMFGFGAEIGISTQKLHARGPMGLKELTTIKYLVTGDGQTR
jgi:glutamate-5-semialdehyde dehydrogenase